MPVILVLICNGSSLHIHSFLYQLLIFVRQGMQVKTLVNFGFFITQRSVLSLQILVRLEEMDQHHLVVTTQVRIMTVKLHCPAVFNSGLCRTLVNTE